MPEQIPEYFGKVWGYAKTDSKNFEEKFCGHARRDVGIFGGKFP